MQEGPPAGETAPPAPHPERVADDLVGPPVLANAPVFGRVSEPAIADVAADLASLDEIERLLSDTDAALRHLDADTYGICETCGTVIDEAVLVTSPVTRHCTRCAPPAAGTLFT